jgi:UDP-N-acetylmuramate dehydrogenase
MQIEQNKDISALNTFGIRVKAEQYVEVNTVEEVLTLIKQGVFESDFLILGGGSNVLFTRDVNGTLVRNQITGISVLEDNKHDVLLHIGAGENWHETVLYCVEKGWAGIENLSLIPGCVGAAPIQNIGAYGVEIKNVLERVHYVELASGEVVIRDNQDCAFGYRDSIFKRELKNKVLITGIEIRLQKTPELKLSYGAIKSQLLEMGINNPGIKDVSNAVIAIRQSKLPDPEVLGNSGSFFKNPVIPSHQFESLLSAYPGIPNYPAGADKVKLAAGWLIEQCGWKGKKVGNTGSHKQQALVLVNYGNATGNEVKELAYKIIASVKDRFGIILEPEVNIL